MAPARASSSPKKITNKVRTYEVREVNGTQHADLIRLFNSLEPSFPELTDNHLRTGFWWIVYFAKKPIGFAGMVPMIPFKGVMYMKRAYIEPGDHRGQGLQWRLLWEREQRCRQLNYHQVVSECAGDNEWSAANFLKARYEQVFPEQPWGTPGSIYFSKLI